jgi:hypothetical protein
MVALHINDIRKLYNEGHYTYKDSTNCDKRRLPEDYVFDENLSVKRNREMVKEHNDEVEHFKRIKQSRQADLDRKLTEDVVAYIKENYNLTEAQARLVEMFTYQEKHSFMCDYFNYIDTFAEFADDIVNFKGVVE